MARSSFSEGSLRTVWMRMPPWRALDRHRVHGPAGHGAVHLLPQHLGDEKGLVIALGQPLQPGGHVDHVPDHRVVHLPFGADVADGDLP